MAKYGSTLTGGVPLTVGLPHARAALPRLGPVSGVWVSRTADPGIVSIIAFPGWGRPDSAPKHVDRLVSFDWAQERPEHGYDGLYITRTIGLVDVEGLPRLVRVWASEAANTVNGDSESDQGTGIHLVDADARTSLTNEGRTPFAIEEASSPCEFFSPSGSHAGPHAVHATTEGDAS